MQAFFISTLTITIGEIGDKTQLLALLLAARFKRPVPIILGILVATLVNHALAGAAGGWIRAAIHPDTLRWVLGISFLLIAAWALIPDQVDDKLESRGKYGVFAITCVTFFLAEMGDKTQIATVALAVKYTDLLQVVAGTTLGMLLADIPAVILGKVASPNFPFKAVRIVSAAIFGILGMIVLFGFQF